MNRAELPIALAAKNQNTFSATMPFARMAASGSLSCERPRAPGAAVRVDA